MSISLRDENLVCMFAFLCILSLTTTTDAVAGAEFRSTLEERVVRSEAIVRGRIERITTYNSVGLEDVSSLSEMDLYSVVELSGAAVLGRFGATPVGGIVRIYIDGGTVPIPVGLQEELGQGLYIQGNTALPTLEVDFDNDVVLFISGNGKYEVPFVSIADSVLKISSDGMILNTAGQPKYEIQDGDFSLPFDPSSIGLVETGRLEIPAPPTRLTYTALLDFIARTLADIDGLLDEQALIAELLNPIIVNEALQTQ